MPALGPDDPSIPWVAGLEPACVHLCFHHAGFFPVSPVFLASLGPHARAAAGTAPQLGAVAGCRAVAHSA